MTDDGKHFVNTLLSAEHFQELEEIREHHGIVSRSDTIRMLIRMERRRIHDLGPTVRDIMGAYKLEHVTAEEVLTAIGGHQDQER